MFRVSVDPYAWLKPIFARLAADPAFGRLAPAHQYAELCRAAAEHSAPKAASMREWDAEAQRALLKHLADSVDELPNPNDRVELWRVHKNARTLRCVAVYLSHGVDLRLMEAEDFRRTELIRLPELVEARAAEWKTALLEKAWSEQ